MGRRQARSFRAGGSAWAKARMRPPEASGLVRGAQGRSGEGEQERERSWRGWGRSWWDFGFQAEVWVLSQGRQAPLVACELSDAASDVF